MDILLAIIVIVINTTLGLMVYLRDRSSRPARLFMVMSLLINLWVLANLITNHNYGYPLVVNDIANRIAFVAGYGIVVAGTLFTYKFPTNRRTGYTEMMLLLVLSVPILYLSATSLVAGTVHYIGQDSPGFTAGPLLWLYALGFLGLVGLLAKNLVIAISKEHGIKKRQGILVLMAFCTSAVLGLLLNAILPLVASSWETTRLGPLVVVILVGMVAYSIIRHGLFDIRLAVVRSAAYVLALITLAGIYYGLAYVTSVAIFQGETTTAVSVSPVNIMLALVLAFAFQPIKRFFDRLTNHLFYRDTYDADEFIASLGALLTSTTHLHEVLELSLAKITQTLKSSSGLFVVYRDHHDDAITSEGKYKKFTEEEYDLLHRLVDIRGSKLLIVNSFVPYSDPDERKLHQILAKRHIALVLPLKSAHETVGHLLLGEPMSTQYSARDLRVLETIANQLIIAIMNARSVEAVRELNIHLEERVGQATRALLRTNRQLLELDETKDEFLSMASHQLRTPLTSIKGYISMVLEGDVGDITPAQRQLLEEAYTSSERMVHLIGDFLNVNRLQTGKFIIDPNEVDLAKVVKQEVDQIRQIAVTHDITVQYKAPARFPRLFVDEGKIRQVIMNFIDNAIYYSPEGKIIRVSLTIEEGDAVLRVTDKGMGVPEKVQKKLFTKFFRAENARKQRPDGTGIGLYLAKKVIDGHSGKLVFESRENKGSTFGFRLPIKKLSSPPGPKVIED